MARYEKGPYSVVVADSGEILVRPGDWLSKYSYAMFGNYTTLADFVRPEPANPQGWKPIDNKNLIYAGETLLYRPAFEQWKKRTPAPPKPPSAEDPAPADPADLRTMDWEAASLGGVDQTEVIVSGGVIVLAFFNRANGRTFFYALPRIGGGLGYDLGQAVEQLKTLFRAMWKVLFLQRMANASFTAVNVRHPFSANDIDYLTVDCAGWDFSSGAPGQNWACEKLTVRDHNDIYGQVVLRSHYLWEFPGGSVHLTGGILLRFW